MSALKQSGGWAIIWRSIEMIKRLKIKFVFVNMLIVTIMLGIIFGTVLIFTKNELENQSIQAMRTTTSMMLRPKPPEGGREDMRLPCFLMVEAADGTLSAEGFSRYDITDKTFLAELNSAVSGKESGTLERYELRFLQVNSRNYRLTAFSDISSEKVVMKSLLKNCALMGGISFGVFLIISLLLSNWVVKPAERAWNEQRQFVADASHELKTPLTVIMTNAEMLREDSFSEEKRRQFSKSILTMSKQMRGLTENLLELARIDNGSVKMTFLPVDLSGLVTDAVLPFEPLYFEKGLELQCRAEDGIFVKGDFDCLLRTVDILLDNAMKYSHPNTAVKLTLERHGTHALLSVENHGEALSKEDLKNIFKRFYRADKARSMNHSYGLGLSIAENIVREHNGKIKAESSDGINKFTVKLPVISK
ncbi:MAG: HAMP domain-containing histidine kinase [Oscillospiraceae bacterium]|nr:HAMP domain-containing histidine kinase [Oscillospiraceae bacterium]